MKKCSICRNSIIAEEPAILFVGRDGDDKEVCTDCDRKVGVLVESDKPEKIKEAINYLYTCWLSANDSEVASYLIDMIESSSSIVEDMEDKKQKSEPVNTTNLRDYFSDRQSEAEVDGGESFWITGMKVIAWIAFAGIIITGIVLAVIVGGYSGGTGFLIFIGSVILAFLSIAMLMIFLNLAQDVSKIKRDISYIRKLLKKKRGL